jgi:hypothetical protein
MARHADGLGHDERRAAFRARGVIIDQPLRHASLDRHVRIHRRVHDAVAQRFRTELERREERRIVCRIHIAHRGRTDDT